MSAVQNNGLALGYFSSDLKNDIDVVKAAVKNDVRALQYASTELKNNKQCASLAVCADLRAIQYVGSTLLDDADFYQQLFSPNIKNDGDAVKQAAAS